MPYDPDVHHRHSTRLREYDYSSAGNYFVTACTQDKERLFGMITEGEMIPNQFADVVSVHWKYLPERYPGIVLDSFVVMPNHIHGIIRIVGAIRESPQVALPRADVGAIHELPQESPRVFPHARHGAIRESPLRRQMLLSKIIGYFKMNSAKRINEMRGTPGRPVWQRNYYEHVIRDGGELDRIREYILTNPLRWGSDRENPDGPAIRSRCRVGAIHELPLRPSGP